jgi:uncharacterized protein
VGGTANLPAGAITTDTRSCSPVKLSLHDSIAAIDSGQWNALAYHAPPFLRHEFLAALESHGAVGGDSGWQPHYLTVARAGRLVGALPMYLKDHSFGEFVFDWAWAAAHERHGVPYYPKLVVATPYTPVSGPRLLTAPDAVDREAIASTLIEAALDDARGLGISSLHWLFTTPEDSERLRAHGLLLRSGCQFHWDNPGYRNFDEFLAALSSRNRKEIRRERRAVAAQGITTEVFDGATATPADWDDLHRFYRSTFLRKGNYPPLTRGFFDEIAGTMGARILLIMARRDGRNIGGALFFVGHDTLYGRHWGANGGFPQLHFELCYYRAIAYCIEHGIGRFEAGAQGEYKVRRGFRPILTRSAHWIADRRFAAPISDFLGAEHRAVLSYVDDMNERLPYRATA